MYQLNVDRFCRLSEVLLQTNLFKISVFLFFFNPFHRFVMIKDSLCSFICIETSEQNKVNPIGNLEHKIKLYYITLFCTIRDCIWITEIYLYSHKKSGHRKPRNETCNRSNWIALWSVDLWCKKYDSLL